jgi:hypothetical protein
MTAPGSQPPERVPTLTEVVAWPETHTAPNAPEPISQHGALEADVIDRSPPPGAGVPAALLHFAEEQIVDRVMADLQRQVDLMLEYRLREILTPILTRAADSVIRDARGELASTLRDVVARAVAQELSRHRTR